MRNESKTYLIELTPIDGFFFANDRLSFDEAVVPYYTRSAYYPQQTGILGLLRHQLLLQNGLLKPGEKGIAEELREAANALIGTHSFDGSAGQSFGAIQSISPLFLLNGTPNNLNFLHFKPESFPYTYSWESKGRCNLGGMDKKGLPRLEGFVAKKHPYGPHWLDQQGKTWEVDDLFVTQERTGIRKRRLAEDHGDKAYYRQVWLQRKIHRDTIELNTRYAVLLELSTAWQFAGEQKNVVLEDTLVHFGAERSLFQLRISPSELTLEDTLPELKTLGASAVYCTSDVWLNPQMLQQIRFSTNVSIRFNNIRNANTDSNHYKRVKLNRHWQWMLRRGAVLYSDDAATLAKVIQDEKAYTRIGYNHVFNHSTTQTFTSNE